MRNRTVRLTLVCVLLVIGAAAGVAGWRLQRRIDGALARERDITGRLQQLIAVADEVGAAQRAYVALGAPDQRWAQRVVELLQQLGAGASTIGPQLSSDEGPAALQSFTDGLEALGKVDARVREALGQGMTLAASDLIFSEARNRLSTTVKTLEDLQHAEQGAADAERAVLTRRLWIVLAATGGLWCLGLLCLAPLGRTGLETATSGQSEPAPLPASASLEPPTPAGTRELAVDLPAAAALCTDISRLSSAAAVPHLLARAAALLHASGIIVWMVSGDDLVAVAAHGYDPRIVKRLGPIGRQANNATAAAWRTGTLTAVSGDPMSNGALVAPMFGADACIGLLAAEVRDGREGNADTCAVASMIAAQLGTVVGVLPTSAADAAQPPASAPTDTGEPRAASAAD